MTGKNSYTFNFSYFFFKNILQRKFQKVSDLAPVSPTCKLISYTDSFFSKFKNRSFIFTKFCNFAGINGLC